MTRASHSPTPPRTTRWAQPALLALAAALTLAACQDDTGRSGVAVDPVNGNNDDNGTNDNNDSPNNDAPDNNDDGGDDAPPCQVQPDLMPRYVPSNGSLPGTLSLLGPIPSSRGVFFHRHNEDGGANPGAMEIFQVELPGFREVRLTEDSNDDSLIDVDAHTLAYLKRVDGSYQVHVQQGTQSSSHATSRGIEQLAWQMRAPRLMDDGALYWWQSEDNAIVRIHGSAVEALPDSEGAVDWPWVKDGSVVWRGLDDDDEVQIYHHEGGETRRLTAGSSNRQSPVVTEGSVFWSEDDMLAALPAEADEPRIEGDPDSRCHAHDADRGRALYVCRSEEEGWYLLLANDSLDASYIGVDHPVQIARIWGDWIAWIAIDGETGDTGTIRLVHIEDNEPIELADVGLGCPGCQVPWPAPALNFRDGVLAWNYAMVDDGSPMSSADGFAIVGCPDE